MDIKKLADHHVSIIACTGAALAAVSVGYAVGFSSPAIQDLQHGDGTLVLNSKEASWFGSLLPLTAIFGSLLSGPFMDFLGRRASIITVVLCYLVSWTTMFFSTALPMLFVGRGLLGLATGMCTAVIPVYISEVSPAFLRGTMGAVFSVFIGLGIPAAYISSVVFNWRGMTEIGGIIACFTFLLCALLPESPYWLLRQNRESEAFGGLRSLRGEKSDVVSEVKEIRLLQDELQNKVTCNELMKRAFLKPIFVGVALMMFQQFSGVNAIFFYAHDIFQRANFHDENLASILVSLVQVVVMIFATILMDHVGRRRLLLYSAFGMMLCHAVLGACMFTLSGGNTEQTRSHELESNAIDPPNGFAVPNNTVENSTLNMEPNIANLSDFGLRENLSQAGTGSNVASWLSLASLILYVVFYSIGFGPVPFIALSEMLPQRGRGVAGGVATMTNWLCAFVITKCFIWMVELITSAGVFWLFSAFCFMAAVFVWKCVPETKGKTLAEVQDIFSQREEKVGRLQPSNGHPERLLARSPIKIVRQVATTSPVLVVKNRSDSLLEQTKNLIRDC